MIWAKKLIQAESKEEQQDLVQAALEHYGRKATDLVNATPWADMPFLIVAMRLAAQAMEQLLGEEAQKTVGKLMNMTTAVAVDMDELRRQGE